MFAEIFETVRKRKPLVHCITNYVTANDVANIILAIGGSPVMADDPKEVEEMTQNSNATYINLGTLNKETIEAMYTASAEANKLQHPIILDPVGVGTTKLRKQLAFNLLKATQLTVIRGNMSEIKTIIDGKNEGYGVDTTTNIDLNNTAFKQNIELVEILAQNTGAIVVASGKNDIVSNGDITYILQGGSPFMSKITGTGCQLSGIIATFIAANPKQELKATVAACLMMNLCGEKAVQRMNSLDGNASLRNYIIDAAFNMTGEELERKAKYEIQ